MQKHSPSEVAQTIKELFRKNGIQLSSFATENNISTNQIYVILNGSDYINGVWSLRFNLTLGVNIYYCMSGILPVMDPKMEYDNLLSASAAYKEAVELEDKLRDEYDLNQDTLNSVEKAAFIKAIVDARKNKQEKSAALSALLVTDNEAAEHTETPMQKPVQTINTPTVMSKLKLHEAIEKVISEAGRPLTFTEIAKQINAKNLYSRVDGGPVPSSQISARVKNYPSWFIVNRDSSPATVSLARNK